MFETQKSQLEAWQARISNAIVNIEELLQENALRLLLDKPNGRYLRQTVCATTRNQLQPALEGLHELWGIRRLVTERIKAAKEDYERWVEWEGLKGARKLLSPAPDANQIERNITELLTGTSVQLPPITTPRAQRKLGSPSAVASKVTPETFWHALEEAYDELNAIVVRITEVQARWRDPLRDVHTNLAKVKSLATDLGVEPPTLTDASTQIEEWRAKVYDDPLSFFDNAGNLINSPDNSSNIVVVLDTALTELEALKLQKDELVNNIAAARQRLEGLAQMRTRVKTSWESATRRVLSPDLVVPDDDSVVAQLTEMLESIDTTAGAGNWRPAVRALSLWSGRITSYEQYLTQSAEHNEAPVNKRLEMRTEFAAWLAKAVEDGISEHPSVSALSQQVRVLLFSKNTDLLRAEQLLDQLRQLIIRLPKTGN